MFLLLQLLINLTFYALHNRVHLVFYDKFICTPPQKKKTRVYTQLVCGLLFLKSAYRRIMSYLCHVVLRMLQWYYAVS